MTLERFPGVTSRIPEGFLGAIHGSRICGKLVRFFRPKKGKNFREEEYSEEHGECDIFEAGLKAR